MKTLFNQDERLPSGWLTVILLLSLLLGIVFRLTNLDLKVFWFDEVYTAFRISGYTAVELTQYLEQNIAGRIIEVQDFLNNFQPFQQVNPEHGIRQTINGLALEESQLPPLYFVLARIWAGWFGTSVAALRSLPALISLLTFPCAYWLGREATGSLLMAWVSVTLMAISPYQILYAQEARPYSLWIVTILLCSAALLRALRRNTLLSWVVYAITLSLAFYSFLFSLFVAVAHGVYVLASNGWRSPKTLFSYLGASVIAILSFLPWLIIVVTNAIKTSPNSVTLIMWIRSTIGNVRRIFVDLGLGVSSPGTMIDNFLAIPLTIFALLALVIVFLKRRQQRECLLILALVLVPQLVLTVTDCVLGAQRSVIFRYLMPSLLGIQLAVAYLFTYQLLNPTLRPQWQRTWRFIFTGLVTLGVLSGVVITRANASWIKYYAVYNPAVAQLINAASQPLLVIGECSSDAPNCVGGMVWNTWSLSQSLYPQVKLTFVLNKEISRIPANVSDVFLYMPSRTLKNELGNQYQLSLVKPEADLWKLERNS